MLLTYSYKQNIYKISIRWTADTGQSTVFRDIVHKAADRHHFDIGGYHDIARYIDELTDNLYEQFYIFNNEYLGVPYNPRLRRAIWSSFLEISDKVRECQIPGAPEHEELLAGLFMYVVDKLQEIADVYLTDSAYQCKFRERRRKGDGYIETTPPSLLSFEFEDVLLQMMELSHQLSHLTEKQRQRLVRHIFLKYTLKEIAKQEGVSGAVIYRSIAAALKKLRPSP